MSTKEPMAFPTINQNSDIFSGAQQGMTLRDYFVAHAPITMADATKALFDSGSKNEVTVMHAINMLVQMRSAYADAMLAERVKVAK